MDPNPTTPPLNEKPKTPETTPTPEPIPTEETTSQPTPTPETTPTEETTSQPTPTPETTQTEETASQSTPTPETTPETTPTPTPTPETTPQPTPQSTSAPTPTPQPTPQPTKKSHTGLIIAIVLIVLFGLPILGFIIFAIVIVGIIGSYDGGNPEIEDIINGIQEDDSVQNVVAGKWDCTGGITTSENGPTKFDVTIKLNKDMTFNYGPYGDLTNNHYSGTYTYNKEQKTDPNDDFIFYMVTLNINEVYIDGEEEELESTDSSPKMEIAITDGEDGREAVTIFTASYNMYYCYEDLE